MVIEGSQYFGGISPYIALKNRPYIWIYMVDSSNQSDPGMAIEEGLHPFCQVYVRWFYHVHGCSIYCLLNRCAMVCTSNKDIRFISHCLKVLIEPLQGSGVQDSWNPRNKGAFSFPILSRSDAVTQAKKVSESYQKLPETTFNGWKPNSQADLGTFQKRLPGSNAGNAAFGCLHRPWEVELSTFDRDWMGFNLRGNL